MTNKELADFIFKDLQLTHDECLIMYPKRNLPDNAIVTRYAPSPTGFVHMGNIYAAFIEGKMAEQTNGVFYLRIEDTDQKRYVKDGIQRIIQDMKNFNIQFDEYPLNETEEIGTYGPYIQSKRTNIYQAFVKYFIEHDLAYPCFCTEQDLSTMRNNQVEVKDRLGYYGSYAKCRSLSIEEAYKRIENGEPYVIRFKSNGHFENKVVVHDLVKGTIEFPENDKDEIILKSTDGLPTYHFAHLVDDLLMGTTHVIRDQNWLSSTPLHLDLFKAYGKVPPHYAHISPVNKKCGDSIRKLSKRKDPEAAVSYYHEKGIPVNAVMLYIATIANSNFEAWYDNNQGKQLSDFKLSFHKISKSGPLFDVEKLNHISRNYISNMKAEEVYMQLCKWSAEFDLEFSNILNQQKDYSIQILNIEREQKKPRKDFSCFSDVKDQIWYMYDELFYKANRIYNWQKIHDMQQITSILTSYFNDYFDMNDDKTIWFNKIRSLCDTLGYASDMKAFKETPHLFKGSVTDISNVLRVAITTKSMTPDLYEIMKLLGAERMKQRIYLVK